MDFISKKITTTSATATGAPDPGITVPSGQVWRVFWSLIQINASNQGPGNRNASLVPIINGVNMRGVASDYEQPASTNVFYSFAPAVVDRTSLGTGDITTPFPEIYLGPGDQIVSSTVGLESEDVVTLTVAYELLPSN